MPSYIIRLDDACQTMNHDNWNRMETLLDRYNVQPIVGVIPDNQDTDFVWPADAAFWEKVRNWQNKGWTIALHGLHHKMFEHEPGGYFQKSHGIHTEFAGVPLEQQRIILDKGMKILKENAVTPSCFFAPAHTYDVNTVKALCEIPEICFISDGYALRPYKKGGMVFVPSICDGPFTMPFGLYTYVFHPSVMKEENFKRLEFFLEKNQNKIVDVNGVLARAEKGQGVIGIMLENGIYFVRGIRTALKK